MDNEGKRKWFAAKTIGIALKKYAGIALLSAGLALQSTAAGMANGITANTRNYAEATKTVYCATPPAMNIFNIKNKRKHAPQSNSSRFILRNKLKKEEIDKAYCIAVNGLTNTKLLPAFAFDYQNFTVYKKNTKILDYTIVIGKNVMNTKNYGPAIMVNGLTNTGEWYQFGISYKFPESISCMGKNYYFGSKYGAFLEIWNKKGKSIFDKYYKFKDAMVKNDVLEIQMRISDGSIVMNLDDLTHGQTLKIKVANETATEFIGVKGLSNKNGFMTGLMTEKYSVKGSPAPGIQEGQLYTSARLDMDAESNRNDVEFVNMLSKVKMKEYYDLFNVDPNSSNSMVSDMENSLYFRRIKDEEGSSNIYIKYLRLPRTIYMYQTMR
jgi:hypothetical protein